MQRSSRISIAEGLTPVAKVSCTAWPAFSSSSKSAVTIARADGAGLDELSVWQHDVEPQDPGARRTVLERTHPVRVGRSHPADGRHLAGPGIWREQEPVRLERRVELCVDDP